ncbi:hypothetical protein MSLAZ_0380 [Methanosarcina lacustris Z-7289]|uniref:SnoaL-like domain-containing protein n=1 Tax=Methanosarcina lacustris Z-7289 TaxID=1434111 RepID=A0A0E3S0W2_9EURY|nr:nuclear transport factor 2 family protein [Methanosarcina lacustris]AKB73641.1 hypothetical protein MSLAZ_0380 [Methanosarcina lacustris Z-7289]
MLRETLKNFYAGILGGEIETLLSLFSDEPLINTPLQGEIRGKANFIRYLSDQRAFLQEHEAKAELFALTDTDQRIVVEFVLYLKHGNKNIDLPVSIVADRSGNTASEIRVYHRTLAAHRKTCRQATSNEPFQAPGRTPDNQEIHGRTSQTGQSSNTGAF